MLFVFPFFIRDKDYTDLRDIFIILSVGIYKINRTSLKNPGNLVNLFGQKVHKVGSSSKACP